jgi:hypothetical protein
LTDLKDLRDELHQESFSGKRLFRIKLKPETNKRVLQSFQPVQAAGKDALLLPI